MLKPTHALPKVLTEWGKRKTGGDSAADLFSMSVPAVLPMGT